MSVREIASTVSNYYTLVVSCYTDSQLGLLFQSQGTQEQQLPKQWACPGGPAGGELGTLGKLGLHGLYEAMTTKMVMTDQSPILIIIKEKSLLLSDPGCSAPGHQVWRCPQDHRLH